MTNAPAAVSSAVGRFNDAVNRHDADAVAAAVTADCIFESTQPPDGDHHDGRAAVRAFFQRLFESAEERTFEVEEQFEAGDRVTVRWVHRWVDRSGRPGHVRGVDVFRVRDGLVAEKLSYVKG